MKDLTTRRRWQEIIRLCTHFSHIYSRRYRDTFHWRGRHTEKAEVRRDRWYYSRRSPEAYKRRNKRRVRLAKLKKQGIE